MAPHIKVLSKPDNLKFNHPVQHKTSSEDEAELDSRHNPASLENPNHHVPLPEDSYSFGCQHQLKLASEAKTFKLIDDRDWNITSTEPTSETTFFVDGHSAMSIVSAIGMKGQGKSSLLNRIAGKAVFETNDSVLSRGAHEHKMSVEHVTRGIDIYSTHHRMLLDCQPLLAGSVLDNFLSGRSNPQFQKNNQVFDSLTNCYMISLQLTTFLIATSDYVIIMSKRLIDVDLLKLIATAIMMIGEDNLRAKLIIFSEDKKLHDTSFKTMINSCIGRNRIDKYFDNEDELLEYIAPYSSEKCDLYQKDPSTFTVEQCQQLQFKLVKNG